MALVHKHLIIRAEVETAPSQPEWCVEWLKRVIDKIGMKVLMGPIAAYVDVPGNKGLTAVAVIETSHIAIHVWDECTPHLVQFDVYSCGELHPELILEELQQFNPHKVEFKFLDREHGLSILND